MRGKINVPETFALLERIVRAGERCPKSSANGAGLVNSASIRELCRLGWIRNRVYVHNWREIEILTGPLKGQRTMGPPNPHSRPYRIMDAESIAASIMPGLVGGRPPQRKIAP